MEREGDYCVTPECWREFLSKLLHLVRNTLYWMIVDWDLSSFHPSSTGGWLIFVILICHFIIVDNPKWIQRHWLIWLVLIYQWGRVNRDVESMNIISIVLYIATIILLNEHSCDVLEWRWLLSLLSLSTLSEVLMSGGNSGAITIILIQSTSCSVQSPVQLVVSQYSITTITLVTLYIWSIVVVVV